MKEERKGDKAVRLVLWPDPRSKSRSNLVSLSTAGQGEAARYAGVRAASSLGSPLRLR